jgi:hypothetical protein
MLLKLAWRINIMRINPFDYNNQRNGGWFSSKPIKKELPRSVVDLKPFSDEDWKRIIAARNEVISEPGLSTTKAPVQKSLLERVKDVFKEKPLPEQHLEPGGGNTGWWM